MVLESLLKVISKTFTAIQPHTDRGEGHSRADVSSMVRRRSCEVIPKGFDWVTLSLDAHLAPLRRVSVDL